MLNYRFRDFFYIHKRVLNHILMDVLYYNEN